MDLSEKQPSYNKEFNKEFRESSIDLADFYELKEKKFLLEEENIELTQRLFSL